MTVALGPPIGPLTVRKTGSSCFSRLAHHYYPSARQSQATRRGMPLQVTHARCPAQLNRTVTAEQATMVWELEPGVD